MGRDARDVPPAGHVFSPFVERLRRQALDWVEVLQDVTRATALFAAVLLAACAGQHAAGRESPPPSGPPPLRVAAVELGDAVGLDKAVVRSREVFAPEDTIHVSVVTEGSSQDTLLTARWSRQGQLLEETSQRIAPDGIATSEFHVWKPGGFEPGEYEVEVAVEGTPMAKRRFTVR